MNISLGNCWRLLLTRLRLIFYFSSRVTKSWCGQSCMNAPRRILYWIYSRQRRSPRAYNPNAMLGLQGAFTSYSCDLGGQTISYTPSTAACYSPEHYAMQPSMDTVDLRSPGSVGSIEPHSSIERRATAYSLHPLSAAPCEGTMPSVVNDPVSDENETASSATCHVTTPNEDIGEYNPAFSTLLPTEVSRYKRDICMWVPSYSNDPYCVYWRVCWMKTPSRSWGELDYTTVDIAIWSVILDP